MTACIAVRSKAFIYPINKKADSILIIAGAVTKYTKNIHSVS